MKFVTVMMIILLLSLTACTGTPAASTVTSTPPDTLNTETTESPLTTTQTTTSTTQTATSTQPTIPVTTSATTVTTTSPSTTTTTAIQTTTPTTTGPYTGPLFDTHLHLDESTLLTRFGTADGLISFLGGRNVNWVIGFCLFPTSGSTATFTSMSSIVSAAGSHIVPLFQDSAWSQFFTSEQNADSILQRYLQPQGIYRGAGEIALYSEDLQSVTFNSPAMQAVFQAVNEIKGIVMIHLSTANMGGRVTELSEIEPSVRDYPDTTFLFHGRKEDIKLVVQLMSNYSNVYFTMDANDSIFTSKLTGYNLLFPDGAAADTAERFLADIQRLGDEALIQNGLDNLLSIPEEYQNHVLWGTDLSSTWHFDDAVFDEVIRLSREVIGRLPADFQEKYAYKNAQAVFGHLLTSN